MCLDARLVTVRDVIYGYGPEIEKSGVDFYGHKTGFTKNSLGTALSAAGFLYQVFTTGRNRELAVRAFKEMPSSELRELLGIVHG